MIRNFLLSAFVVTGLVACQEETTTGTDVTGTTAPTSVSAETPAGAAAATALTEAAWVEKAHDFGQIPQGEPVTHTFTVKNSGTQPLIISDVKASCGCTATDYTREAIPPGGEGMVQARYNAAAEGVFNKSVTVTYNTSAQREVLALKGTVLPANK